MADPTLNTLPASKLSTTLPVSPLLPSSAGPAAQAGTVQINLGDITGQVVTGGEFGLATTMGTPNWSYASYADATFQALANQYPTDLLRHNWELNTFMDLMFPTRASASTPDYSRIDTYLNQQGNLKNLFNNQTATQIVTLGFPSWLNISDPADQALYANMVKGIAQHFIAAGEPINNYELVNEPDGHYSPTDMAHTFNVVAEALKPVDPSYKLGGLTETYARQDDLQTFFNIAGQNIGFVSWHQYVTGDSSSKSSQQEVTDSMGVANTAHSVRAQMQAAGIPDSVPMFLGEYNVDGGNYSDPNNGNMVGALAAAATTYGMIHANANMPMGALWDVQNDSAYSVFGSQGNYQIDSVGILLGDLTSYMPGNLVQTTMPSDTPGLVGYTTTDNNLFSTALIDTNLSQGYTVDLSKDGLPTTGLYRIEVSPSNPQGSKTAITDLSHVSVAAGSVVIISDENPHSGTELNGTTSTAPIPPPVPPSTPTPIPTPIATLPPTPTPTPVPTPPPTQTPTPVPTQPSAPTPNPVPTPLPPPTLAAPPAQNEPAPPVAGTAPGGAMMPPLRPPVGTPPPIGTGPDTMVLKLSEDAYKGDAQFVLTVDGKQVGPAQSVTALRSQGQSESVTLKGDFGTGPHQFGVSYINDLWDGTPATDRNLYIDSATFNGDQVLNGVELLKNGTVPFGTAPASQPVSQPGTPGGAGATITNPAPSPIAAPPTVGSGPDTIVLNLSENAYRGDAEFVLTVDDKPVGPAQSVTALHNQGQTEAFTIKGDFGADPHQIGVSYIDDLWDGTDATDRNLWIDSATFNRGRVENTVLLQTNSTAVFGSAAFAQPSPPPAAPSNAVPTSSGVAQAAPVAVIPTPVNTAPAAVPPNNPSPLVPAPGTTPGVSAPGNPGLGGPGVPPTVGTGPDTVTLNLSEDASQGDAQFVFTVDGQQVGTAQSVTALHGQGPSEAFTFRGDWGTGAHQFGVALANGATDGSGASNRHLYLDSAAFDANLVANATQVVSSTPVTFGMAAIAAPPGQPIGASAPATNQNTVPGTGGPMAPNTPSTGAARPVANQSSSTPVAAINTQTLAFGSGTQSMSFASPVNLTITGGSGTDAVTATSGTNSFIAGTGSMDITGGSGASDFILHAGGGKLTIQDFLASKGDAITVDKALQPDFKQTSDGHGGTLLTFGANQGSIDLIRVPSITPSNITFA